MLAKEQHQIATPQGLYQEEVGRVFHFDVISTQLVFTEGDFAFIFIIRVVIIVENEQRVVDTLDY